MLGSAMPPRTKATSYVGSTLLSGEFPGGFHLLAASKERVERTLTMFEQWNVQRIVAGHCTGWSAVARKWNTFGGCCSSCAVGTTMDFDDRGS